LTDIYFKNEDQQKNESESINLDQNKDYNREEQNEEPKDKNHKYVNVILILIGISIISWFVYNFFQKKIETAKNNRRIEMIADSTYKAMKIKQIKESLEKQKIDSIRRDSIKIKNFERQKAIIDSLNSLNLSREKSGNELNDKSKEKSNLSNKPISKDIFNQPRNFTEFLATEKLVQGSKLAQFAKKYYGHAYFWVYIYEANRNVIKNPNNVPLGITVKIPKVDSRLIDPSNKECLNYALGLQAKYLK
jgi:heme/copper-type cytochrome/quinol oxidase subunit 2